MKKFINKSYPLIPLPINMRKKKRAIKCKRMKLKRAQSLYVKENEEFITPQMPV